MKLLRYRNGTSIKPGILDQDNTIKDASSLVYDWTSKTMNAEIMHMVKNYNIASLPSVKDKVSISYP